MTTLVIAWSGRALAQAARHAGEPCIVADLFADADTRALAQECLRLDGDLASGFDRAALLGLLERVRGRVDGLVYGAGFEADPSLLEEAAAIIPMLGNAAAVVRAVKDPAGAAALFAAAGLATPEWQLQRPSRAGGWLRKRVGGSGGGHVRPATAAGDDGPHYYQRRVKGRAVGALFLADGRRARLIGLTRQTCDPAPGAPFRFGGCAGPASFEADLVLKIAGSIDTITAEAGLVGLCSLDLMVDGDTIQALEINPRPGASLDVFDPLVEPPLWSLHRQAVGGVLPERLDPATSVKAVRIVHAPRLFHVKHGMDWPPGSADRPLPGTRIAAGEPICTVFSVGRTLSAARAGAEARMRYVLDMLFSAAADAA